jgi:hypothetical protein
MSIFLFACKLSFGISCLRPLLASINRDIITFMEYSSLTQDQHLQVDYLFADVAFGTDPTAFDYEIDRAGKIAGRKPFKQAKPMRLTRHKCQAKVIALEEVNPTAEQIKLSEMSMDALAASIARELHHKDNEK